MKHFIIKLLVFLSIPLCYFGISSVINFLIYTNQSISIADTEILIVGDSHTELSLNPQYFRSSQNISQSAEPYFLTFWKLKRIFKQYIPDTLILGFAPHNISQFNDMKMSDSRWSSEMFLRSYPIEHYNEIGDRISIDYSAFYKILFKQIAFYPKNNHINYIGKYSNRISSNISDWESATKRHYFLNNIELGVSKVAISYIDSIANLCVSKNIALVLVSNPIHKNYLNNVPLSMIKEYKYLGNKYKEKHLVIDKTRDVYPDSLFLNSDHLNEYGAIKFTREIIDELKKAQMHNTLSK